MAPPKSPKCDRGNSHFGQMLNSLKNFREDCWVLMAGEDGPTKAGYDSVSVKYMYRIAGTVRATLRCDTNTVDK